MPVGVGMDKLNKRVLVFFPTGPEGGMFTHQISLWVFDAPKTLSHSFAEACILHEVRSEHTCCWLIKFYALKHDCSFAFFFFFPSEAVDLSLDIMGQIQVIQVCINPIWGIQLSNVLVFSVGAAANYCPGLTEVSDVLFSFEWRICSCVRLHV